MLAQHILGIYSVSPVLLQHILDIYSVYTEYIINAVGLLNHSCLDFQRGKMGKCYDCNDCGTKLSSYYSHWRHRKNSCPLKSKDVELQQKFGASNTAHTDSSENFKVRMKNDSIPTFDGNEFDGKTSKSVNTVSKILEMLNIPEEKRDHQIAKDKR